MIQEIPPMTVISSEDYDSHAAVAIGAITARQKEQFVGLPCSKGSCQLVLSGQAYFI